MTANLTESPVVISTPAWLQRRMMRNLQAAARNRVNRKRAVKAREILAAIDRDTTPQMARHPDETVALTEVASTAKAIEQTTKREPAGGNTRRSHKSWTARLGSAAQAILGRAYRWRCQARAHNGTKTADKWR